MENIKKSSVTMRMTEGSIAKHIIAFAIPIFLANILQQLYSLTDAKIVAAFLGEDAFSAVASTASLSNLFLGFAFGFTYGFSIIISKYFGARDFQKVKSVYASGLYLSMIIAFALTAIELIFLEDILILMQTPPELIDSSFLYMSVIILGTPFAVMYNLFANTLRSLGNSRVSLYVLLASVIFNAGFDLCCVAVFKMGIVGAAVATITAQLMCAVMCYIYIIKKVPELKVKKEHFKTSFTEIKNMLSLGFSMAMMNSLVSLGSIFLQSSINGFGTKIISGHAAARRLDEIMMMPHASIANSMAVFAGQNYGAKRLDRIKKSVTISLCICFAFNILATVIVLLIGSWFVSWLSGSSNPTTIETGFLYLAINVPSQIVLSVMHVYRGVLQGVGKGFISTLSGAVELAIKALFTFIIAKELGYLAVAISEPVSWLMMTIVVVISCLLFFKKTERAFAASEVEVHTPLSS